MGILDQLRDEVTRKQESETVQENLEQQLKLNYQTEILPKMQQVFSSMTAEMSLNEKLHVVSFLQQMNDYHIKKISK